MPIVSSRIIESGLSWSVFKAHIRYHIGIHHELQTLLEVDYECELALFPTKDSRNVSTSEALSSVADFTYANEVSACR